jgi:hypothetical protein
MLSKVQRALRTSAMFSMIEGGRGTVGFRSGYSECVQNRLTLHLLGHHYHQYLNYLLLM